MADVAAAAGVSRQTLYNEFGTKDALAQALALRETARFLNGTEAALTGHEGAPADAVAAAVAYTLREAADNPLLKAVLTDDAGGLLPLLTTRGEPVQTQARTRIAAYLTAHWPHLPADEVDLVAEVVVRLTVSHLVLPTEPVELTAARTAHLVDKLLVPHSRRTS
jgi:AcrR family transcriptional regulator